MVEIVNSENGNKFEISHILVNQCGKLPKLSKQSQFEFDCELLRLINEIVKKIIITVHNWKTITHN